jgi:hypothetical protein
MTTPARIVRLVGITGLVCWVGLVGWLAKTSLAQNGAQAPPPALPAPKTDSAVKVETRGALPPPPPLAPADTPNPALATLPPVSQEKPLTLPEPKHEEPVAPPAIEPEFPQGVKTRAAEPAVPALPVSEATAVNLTEDPEISAQSFVERNQKEAEHHLKTLTNEAVNLRTRLNKLESGIKKWENLVNALRTAQQGPVTSTAVTSGAEEAGDLEPIRPGTPGGARGEKRVKWSTAAGSGNTAPAASDVNAPPAAEVTEPAAGAPLPAQPPAARPVQAAAPGAVPR